MSDLWDCIIVGVLLTLSLTISQVTLTLTAIRTRGWMIQQRDDLEQMRQLITRDWE